jgi:predicted nucleic acid-binding protein
LIVIFVDTNILLRSVDTSTEHYPIVEKALAKRRGRQETLCIAPQNVVGFWSVATRPQDKNGLGMSSSRAASEITALRALFRVLPYTADVLPAWERLVLAQGVSGKQSHDAHLVALMQVHSVMSILTFNGDDFKRYPGITVLKPEEV